jgi:hypothetical protein
MMVTIATVLCNWGNTMWVNHADDGLHPFDASLAFPPSLGSTTLERRRIDVSESDGINESLMNNGKE